MKILLWIAASILSFYCKDIWADNNGYKREHDPIFPFSNSLKDHPLSNYERNSTRKNLLFIKSKTDYGFHAVQSNSAEHKKQNNINSSNISTQYYFVTTNTTAFNIPRRSSKSTYKHQTGTQNEHTHRYFERSITCIRCPPEKLIIARKGLDGILVEPPQLRSCQNKAIVKNMYEIQTLFGPQFKFLLPHGIHSIHTKIVNKQTGKHIQNCILRYQIVVQRCEQFTLRDQNIKMDCDIANIWGSRCYFTCKAGYLSHKHPIVCGDGLKWEGRQPECLPYPPLVNRMITPSDQIKSCSFLSAPDHGKLSCEYPEDIENKNYENNLKTPEKTVCRVTCDNNYQIPNYLEPYNILLCKNGQWNESTKIFCQPKMFHIK